MLRRKMRHFFGREGLRTSNLVNERSTMIRITDMRGDLKGRRSRL